MEVIEVPEKLNDEGHENITLQKLIGFQEPKEKATISRTLRNIKMCPSVILVSVSSSMFLQKSEVK